ncbi:hypothetical protein M8C21_028819, partial [Ambrosia artemisiifolia]
NDNVTGVQDSNVDNDPKKNSCSCAKSDFFPEESFQSWSNYGKALMETRARLKERLFARSSDDHEIYWIKVWAGCWTAVAGLKKIWACSWWACCWSSCWSKSFAKSQVLLFTIHVCNKIHGLRTRSQNQIKRNLNWFDLIWFGVGAVMGTGVFVLTGEAAHDLAGPAILISYLISGCAALLSVICYTEFAVELPVAGGSWNILFEYVVAGASVSRSWTSYCATLFNHKPNEFRISMPSMGKGFDYWDPMVVAVSVVICIVASFSMKGSSRFNSVATIIHIGVLLFIIIAGATKANLANFDPFAPFGFRGFMCDIFAYVGFDGVATLGEETKKPGRDIPIGLVGSMMIVITTYSLLATIVCLMQPYNQIDVDAPFTIAFEVVGMNSAKLLVGIGALKGMTTVLLATIIAESRYFTHIARTHMAPPILAVVHKKLGTPVNAAVIMTATNCVVAFFTSLDVLASLLSISTLFIFSVVAIGLLVRRYYSTGQARSPKLWGAPFVPWLPSGSIALNLYMMGSIDGASFLRFMGWTVILHSCGIACFVERGNDGERVLATSIKCSISSTIALNHFGLPFDNMRYPRTIPSKVPHPYPITTTFHVNPFSSSPSPSPSGCGFCKCSLHLLGNGTPQSFGFPPNEYSSNRRQVSKALRDLSYELVPRQGVALQTHYEISRELANFEMAI